MAEALATRPATTRATWVGEVAAAALERSRGRFALLDAAGGGNWAQASGTMIWLGLRGPLHPRTVLVEKALLVRIDLSGARRWRTPDAARLQASCRHGVLCERIAALGDVLATRAPNNGFAPLLADRPPAFPLSARAATALAAMHAARSNAPAVFVQHAMRLIGAGAGLTPSGDDLLGGALFAVHALYPRSPAWRASAATVCAAAAGRTHPVSAALLADHAAGVSFAAMHELLDRAVAGAPLARLVESAAAVAAIGSSSGWDMLTGLILATAPPQSSI